MRQIEIVLHAASVNPTEFLSGVAACRRQVSEHFARAWGGLAADISATVSAPKTPLKPGGETIYVLDDSDQQGALGYHDVATADFPVGYVFARTSAKYGSPWTVTLSHELLEQLADPFCNTGVAARWHGRPALVAYETCDPVEDDAYEIDGVPVSNFVTPAWFQMPGPGIKGPYDHMNILPQPLSVRPGGYVAYTTDLVHWRQDMHRDKVGRAKKYHRAGR